MVDIKINADMLRRYLGALRLPNQKALLSMGLSNIDGQKLRETAEERGILRRKEAQPSLTDQEIEQLRQDLEAQTRLRGSEEASQVVPDPKVQQEVQRVFSGNTQQRNKGILGGVKGTLMGAGGGAVLTGLGQGIDMAPVGLLRGAVPGALRGYQKGKQKERSQQLEGILRQQYQQEPKVAGTAVGWRKAMEKNIPETTQRQHGRHRSTSRTSARWRREMDPGFREVFDELKQDKQKGILKPTQVPGVLRDLKEVRGKGLSAEESRLLKKQLGAKLYPKKVVNPAGGGFSRFEKTVKKLQKGLLTPKGPKNFKALVKANPKSFAVLGGLAALGALGLSAGKMQEYRSRSKQDPKKH